MNAMPTQRAPSAHVRALLWGGAATLLLLPALLMRVSDEVTWDARDFIVFGAMLLAACILAEAALRRFRGLAGIAGTTLAVGAGFVLAWANLAVGVIDDPANPANLVFFAILAMVAAGSLLARLRPAGTVRALLAGAAALALATPWALVADGPTAAIACALVATAWAASAGLLHRAAGAAHA